MQQVAGGDDLDTSDEEGEEDSHSSDESSDDQGVPKSYTPNPAP